MIIQQTTHIVFEYPQDYLQEQEWCKTKTDEWIHVGTDTRCSIYENKISYSTGQPNSSEKPNNSTISILEQVEPQTEQWHYDEKDNTWYPYQHKSCSTCKHALGNWDGESNNCGRCCGADRRFYEPKDEQTERSSE